MTFRHSQKGVSKKIKATARKIFPGGSGPPSTLHFQLRHELVPLQSEKRSYGPDKHITNCNTYKLLCNTTKKMSQGVKYYYTSVEDETEQKTRQQNKTQGSKQGKQIINQNIRVLTPLRRGYCCKENYKKIYKSNAQSSGEQRGVLWYDPLTCSMRTASTHFHGGVLRLPKGCGVVAIRTRRRICILQNDWLAFERNNPLLQGGSHLADMERMSRDFSLQQNQIKV